LLTYHNRLFVRVLIKKSFALLLKRLLPVIFFLNPASECKISTDNR
jgi:hypothetical protein